MMVISSIKNRTLENICANKYLDKEQLMRTVFLNGKTIGFIWTEGISVA